MGFGLRGVRLEFDEVGAWGVGEEGRELGGIADECVGEIPEIGKGFE